MAARDDFPALQLTLRRNWATALQSYREAIDLYRHVVAIRSRRQKSPFRAAIPAQPGHTAQGTVVAGHTQPPEFRCLTPREREVLDLMALGCTNQQIAQRLVLTKGTVANHVAHILAKLGLDNRTQVAAAAYGRVPAPETSYPVRTPAAPA